MFKLFLLFFFSANDVLLSHMITFLNDKVGQVLVKLKTNNVSISSVYL